MSFKHNSPLYDPDFDVLVEEKSDLKGTVMSGSKESNKTGEFELLRNVTPMKLFLLGGIVSVLVLCTIGFFVMLSVVL